jgi:hypothetical protein
VAGSAWVPSRTCTHTSEAVCDELTCTDPLQPMAVEAGCAPPVAAATPVSKQASKSKQCFKGVFAPDKQAS